MTQPDLTLRNLPRLAAQTLVSPKPSLRRVLDLNLSIRDTIQGATVILILGVLITEALLLIAPAKETSEVVGTGVSPVTFVAMQLIFFVICSLCFHMLPRFFGGKGTLIEAFSAVLWLNFVLFILQMLFSIALVFFPAGASLLVLFILYFVFMLMVTFVQEVHGFENTFLVFIGVIFGTFLVGLIALPILLLLGIVPMEVPDV